MLILPYYLCGESQVSYLDDAKECYDKGNYDRAIELFNKFIEKNRGNKTLKNELIEAYYYKAKIYYTGEQYALMEDSLKNLFQLDLQYNFPGEKNTDFLRRAFEVQKVAVNVVVKEKNKKKFPWLVVVGTVVVVGAAVFLLTKKPKENTLTVSIGDGVDGNPVSGTHSYKKSSTVSYSYTLKTGYTNLVVKLDGTNVDSSGTIKMDRSHTLTANAAKNFTLTVNRGEGVNGSPDTGTFFYTDGETVNYNYSLQNGYVDLVVTLDGLTVPASGSILMNQSHTLAAVAGKTYTLQVTKGEGITGIPDSGTSVLKEGYIVNYGYTLQKGYSNLVVLLDGVQVVATGTIKMDKNHILIASAGKTFTLTVIKGTGVEGEPNTGSYTYNQGDTVVYNFSLKSNYKNLTVTLDGTQVAANGTFTMTANRTLTASAEPL